jgi:hypothetical protein
MAAGRGQAASAGRRGWQARPSSTGIPDGRHVAQLRDESTVNIICLLEFPGSDRVMPSIYSPILNGAALAMINII